MNGTAGNGTAGNGTAGNDRAIEREILDLLGARAAGATICPSEVARSLAPEDWRPLMDDVRAVARRLVGTGEIEVTQRGEVVDPATARGPIRLRRRPDGEEA